METTTLHKNKLNWYSAVCYELPDEKTLKEQFNISKKKYKLLNSLFNKWVLSNANVFHYTSEYINRENYFFKSNYKVNKVMQELNEIMKHMYKIITINMKM